MRNPNIVGARIGRWLVLPGIKKIASGGIFHECRCVCGREKFVNRGDLLGGRSWSCGCYRDQAAKNRFSIEKDLLLDQEVNYKKNILSNLGHDYIKSEDVDMEPSIEEKAKMIDYQLLNTPESVLPEEFVLSLEMRDIIEKLLSRLTEREAQVVVMRFGLDDGVEHTFEEIGKTIYNYSDHCLGTTRERVRQIEARAVRKMGKKV